MYRPDEESGGAGIGPAGSVPVGSYFTDEPTVELGAALLDLEFDERPLDFIFDDK